MKRLLSIILAGTLISFLATWGLSQVPASLVKSGLILGNSGASATLSGTATFTIVGTSITGLRTNGLITNVTRSSTGVYVVTLTGASAGYAIQAIGGSSTATITFQLNPAASYLTSGFTITAVANVATLVDPDFVSISVIQ